MPRSPLKLTDLSRSSLSYAPSGNSGVAEVSGAAAVHIMIHFFRSVLNTTAPLPFTTPLFSTTGLVGSLTSTNPPLAGSSRCLPLAHMAIRGSPPLIVEPGSMACISMLWMYDFRSRKSSAPIARRNGGVPPPGVSPVTCPRAAMDPANPAAAAPNSVLRLMSLGMGRLLARGWGKFLRERRLRTYYAGQRGIGALFILIRSAHANGADHLIVHHDGKSAGSGKHADARPAQL